MTDDSVAERIPNILSQLYHRLITGEPAEGYLGQVLEFPGCYTAGGTPEEALRNLDEAMAVWVESALVHGDLIPEPATGPVRLIA